MTKDVTHCSRASSDDGDEDASVQEGGALTHVRMYVCKPGEQAGGEGNPMAKSGDGRDTAKETTSHF